MPLPKGEAKVLMRGVFARYSPTGHLLVVTADGKLVAVPFDPEKLAFTGPPIGLLEGIGVEVGGFSTNLALSGTGTLVYTTGGAARSQQPVWVTREGLATPVDSAWQPQGPLGSFALSPDGRALAVEMVLNGNNSLWIKRIAVGALLPAHLRRHLEPPADLVSRRTLAGLRRQRGHQRWLSHDPAGRRHRRRTGAGALAVRLGTGAGDPGREVDPGTALVLRGRGRRPLRRPGRATRPLVPLVTSPATEVEPAVSPDGRWLAYTSDESGTSEIYVRPFPDAGSARWQVSTAGGGDPLWSHSGRELFYRSAQEAMMSVAIRPGATFAFEQPKALFSTANYLPHNARPVV